MIRLRSDCRQCCCKHYNEDYKSKCPDLSAEGETLVETVVRLAKEEVR